MNKRAILLLLTVFMLSACAQYAVIKPEQQSIKSIVVTPTEEWNDVPRNFSVAGLPTWTIDGISLNSLSFVSDIKDGQPLIENGNEKEYPKFKSDMLPTELAELFESTIAIAFEAKITEPGAMRPIKIGGHQGFEYDFEFVASDELLRKGYVAAAVKDETLHMIFYQAPRLHYFDTNYQSVKHLVNNAAIK